MLPPRPSDPWVVGTLDVLFWPVVHVALSYLAFRRPDSSFNLTHWLYRPRPWELSPGFYVSGLQVKRWKRKLPDGAKLFSGTFNKDRIRSRDRRYLEKFEIETCRAEWAHWMMLICAPLSFFWNPLWACWVMGVYGLAANLPFIVVQRHNRIVLRRLVNRARERLPNHGLHL